MRKRHGGALKVEEIEVTQIDPALVKRGTPLFKLLGKSKLTLATAESCTGG